MNSNTIHEHLQKEIHLENPHFSPNDVVDIGFGVDDNYVRYMIASMISFCENNRQKAIHFHVITNTIKDVNINRIRNTVNRYNIRVSIYFINVESLADFPMFHQDISIATYFRFFLPYCIRDASRLLYVDADIICNGSLDELLSLDLQHHAVAAVPDMEIMKKRRNVALGFLPEHKYFNAGVLLIDLQHWAELNVFEKATDIIRNYGKRIQFEDQDVLNILFKDEVLYLSPIYNCIDMRHIRCVDAKLLHFASHPKPWSRWWFLNPNCNMDNKEIYQRYEDLSGGSYPQTDRYNVRLLAKSLLKRLFYRYLSGRVQKT